jgi:hypothetical protein
MIHTEATEFVTTLEKFTSFIREYSEGDLFQIRLATRERPHELAGLLVCRGALHVILLVSALLRRWLSRD